MCFHLLIFFYFLLGAYAAELFPLLIGDPEIVLGRPQMENPDAVHTHKEHRVGYELRERETEGKVRGEESAAEEINDTLFIILLYFQHNNSMVT